MDSESEFVEPPDELKDGNCDVEYASRSLADKPKYESRTEFTTEVSEFHASAVDGKLELYDLVKKLSGDKVEHSVLRKRLRRVEKKDKVLEVPLNKHELEQITRVVQYAKTTKDVSIWEPIVQKNRKADQLIFPVNKEQVTIHQTLPEFTQHRQPRSQLEQQIAAVLRQSEPVVEAINKQQLSKVQEAALTAMNLQEARLKRAELQKDRARAAFVAAKLRLQGKIKSKKYHRIQRRSRSKQEKKRLEQMSTEDSEAYQELIEKTERQRIQERMSLRHKGTSRFMQKQTRYGKFNMASRQAVQDMLQEGQNLRHKSTVTIGEREGNDSDSDMSLIDQTTDRKQTLEDLENIGEELSGDEDLAGQVVDMEELAVEMDEQRKVKVDIRIDPSQYLVVENDRPSALEDGSTKSGSGKGDGNGSSGGIALAFAGDDDVVAEFLAEKKKTVEREQVKDIDLRLPGWGQWSGPGITMSKQRKKRFIIKAPVGPARKDQQLDHVIISEKKDVAIAKHQVNALPHPFKRVAEFERRISESVGRQWNTVDKFKKLTKPRVIARLGHVITPIDKTHTFNKQVTLGNRRTADRQ